MASMISFDCWSNIKQINEALSLNSFFINVTKSICSTQSTSINIMYMIEDSGSFHFYLLELSLNHLFLGALGIGWQFGVSSIWLASYQFVCFAFIRLSSLFLFRTLLIYFKGIGDEEKESNKSHDDSEITQQVTNDNIQTGVGLVDIKQYEIICIFHYPLRLDEEVKDKANNHSYWANNKIIPHYDSACFILLLSITLSWEKGIEHKEVN